MTLRGNTPTLLSVSIISALLLQGCGGDSSSTANEDVSVSGAVAGVVGGSLSGSNSTGTLVRVTPNELPFQKLGQVLEAFLDIPNAIAGSSCPTYQTASGSGCSVQGGTMWLSYSTCSFGGNSATWTGVQALIESSGTATCGTFPNPGASQSLFRQFTASSGSTAPANGSRVNQFGTTVAVDDASTNLKNFDSETIATLKNGGYGDEVVFNSGGARSSITVARRLVSSHYDLSIDGSVNVTEVPGGTSRTLSGTFNVFHNTLQIVGSTTFTGLNHDDSCCYPTAGTITTTYVTGKNVTTPTTAGKSYDGKTETLVLNGCGNGTMTDISGSTYSVTIANCI